jgi:hypothetical protein
VGATADLPVRAASGLHLQAEKSLTYVVSVHLIFDFVLFLALVHARNPDWLPIFLYCVCSIG